MPSAQPFYSFSYQKWPIPKKSVYRLSHRPELVSDKHGIKVTSDPPGDENGVVELRAESGTNGQIVLIIENASDETITLQHITLMWSVNFFDYSEISRIGHEGNLQPGNYYLS